MVCESPDTTHHLHLPPGSRPNIHVRPQLGFCPGNSYINVPYNWQDVENGEESVIVLREAASLYGMERPRRADGPGIDLAAPEDGMKHKFDLCEYERCLAGHTNLRSVTTSDTGRNQNQYERLAAISKHECSHN